MMAPDDPARSWHFLALQLGGTVAELQARLSYREWVDWCAYFELTQAPPGDKPAAPPPIPGPAPAASGNPLLNKFKAIIGQT